MSIATLDAASIDPATPDLVAFPDCAVCGEQAWIPIYEGPVRDGAFGNSRASGMVAECVGCGVRRLDEH